jgi:hypothetical protein
MMELHSGIASVFSAQADAYFGRSRRPDGVSGLAAIFARDDYDDHMPLRLLTTLGAAGVAAHDDPSQMLTSDDFLDFLAKYIRQGAFAPEQ